jgi:MFS family permease
MSAWRLAGGIVVLVSGSLLAWLLRYGTAVVLPAFQADFGADAAALGALAAAYFWPYAAMQPFSGVLSDTWGPRRTLAVWLAVAAAGTAIFALAPTYEVALVGRALGGAGVGIVLVVAFSLLGQWFGTERFGTIAGLYAATGPLGGLLAAHPLALLAEAFGWRIAFTVVAAWLLLTALGAAAILPGAPARAAAPSLGGALRGLARAARLRNLWPGAAYAFVALGILSAMQGLWTLPYLTTAYPISPAAATDVLQAWSIGLLLALPAWGYVADRVLRSNKRTLLASLGLQAAPWLLLCLAPAAWPADALFALFLFLALTNGCWMPAYALVNRAAPAELRGSALGLLNLAFFLGAACFQQASGALLTWLTPGPGPAPLDAYRWLFALFLAALGLAALALTAAREPRR